MKGTEAGGRGWRHRSGTLGWIVLAVTAVLAVPAPFLFVCACSCGVAASPVALPEVPFLPLLVVGGAATGVLVLRRRRVRRFPSLRRVAGRLLAVFMFVALLSAVVGAAAGVYASARPEPITATTPACGCDSGYQGASGGVGDGGLVDGGDGDGGVRSGVSGLADGPGVPSVGSGAMPLAGAGVTAAGAMLLVIARIARRRGRVST